MNNTLDSLIHAVYKAEEKVSDAEAARDSFLEPILRVLKATGGEISHCFTDSDKIYITRSGSCRGSEWNENYTFPLTIFTSEIPIEVAASYVAKQKRLQENIDRRTKLATIERLQNELGVK